MLSTWMPWKIKYVFLGYGYMYGLSIRITRFRSPRSLFWQNKFRMCLRYLFRCPIGTDNLQNSDHLGPRGSGIRLEVRVLVCLLTSQWMIVMNCAA